MVPYQRVFIKLILIFAGISLALIILILFDRLFGIYLQKKGYFQAMLPNVTEIYQTNEFNVTAKISSQGLRNEEVIVPKPKGVHRILVLGDSFTFGWGVNLEDSWPKVLEKMLSKDGVEVINAGVYGASLDQEARVCESYSRQFDPDLIILGFYSTDDLYQAAAVLSETKKNKSIVSTIFPNLFSVKEPIFAKNYFARSGDRVRLSSIWITKAKVLAHRQSEFFSSLDNQVQKALLEGKLNPGLVFTSLEDPDYLIRMLDEQDLNYALKATDISLKKVKDRCQSNIPLVVVFLPSSELISEEFFPYKIGLGYKVSSELLKLDIDLRLGKIVSKHGLYYVSLLDNFRKDDCVECFYKWDMHLTPLGNKKAAEYLVPAISAMIKR